MTVDGSRLVVGDFCANVNGRDDLWQQWKHRALRRTIGICWSGSTQFSLQDPYTCWFEKFPRHETYGLVDQLRRAAVSVPSNIAEGQARRTPADFRRFLHIALGSLVELDTQLVLALEFGYVGEKDLIPFDEQIHDLRIKLDALIKSLPEK